MQRAKVREEKEQKAQIRENPEKLVNFKYGFDKSRLPAVRESVSSPRRKNCGRSYVVS